MKASRGLLLLLLLPAFVVVVFSLVLVYGSLSSLRGQFSVASTAQSGDLMVIADAGSFSRDMGIIQKRMMAALNGALDGSLSEIQLYRMHTAIVNDLESLGERVRQLAESELVVDANHNSARGLLDEFEAYRRFMIMTTDVIAVNPAVAAGFMELARTHYREFSIFASRIVYLLAERSAERNQAQAHTFDSVYANVLFVGLISLLTLLAVIYLAARRASSHMLVIADALSTLARSEGLRIPLPAVEAMHRRATGEFGRIAGTLLLFRDAIERRRQAEEEAFQLAFYDPLTRLPNRRLLGERLSHATGVCRDLRRHAAVMMIDLDGFKAINDVRGHAVGDRVLVETGDRLRQALGDSDTVARLGGDEFAILLESLSPVRADAARQAEAAAVRVRKIFENGFEVDGEPVFVTASVGIVLIDEDVEDVDAPLKYAEAAMYQAKSDGRDTHRFYDPEVQAQLAARVHLENELRQAVERRELRLFYQVQVNQFEGACGVEALLRWEHSEKGLVSPAQFIPLAEESGLIVPIGRWVLETACRQLKRWERDPARGHLSIAVNVSARQFRQDDFVDQVIEVLRETGADPHRLKLELTESTVLADVEATIRRMKDLRAVGIRFSMDDFGTGYSSLQYLKRLPLDQLKIDQSFVRDIIGDADDDVIVQTIIAMSHALGLEVIAEGVETPEQQRFLLENGCETYQGYLFGRPVPVDVLEESLCALTAAAGRAKEQPDAVQPMAR